MVNLCVWVCGFDQNDGNIYVESSTFSFAIRFMGFIDFLTSKRFQFSGKQTHKRAECVTDTNFPLGNNAPTTHRTMIPYTDSLNDSFSSCIILHLNTDDVVYVFQIG